jgi:hypothetical protein
VRLDHPRRDRGDTGIGRAAKAVRLASQVTMIGLMKPFRITSFPRLGPRVFRSARFEKKFVVCIVDRP